MPRLLDTVSKFALFSMSDLKDEKLMKKANLLNHANSILETFEILLPNNVKIDPYDFELYIPFQSWAVF